MIRPHFLAGLPVLAVTLAGCFDAQQVGKINIVPPQLGTATAPNACFATETLPAVVETITTRTLVDPETRAEDGTVISPAKYRSVSSQTIVSERQETTFEIPCKAQLTPDFIATLQRALKARGYFGGDITGKMDPATTTAVSAYQATLRLPTATLSMDGARQLGLIAYSRDDVLADGF